MVAVLHSAPEVAEPEALAAWTDRVSEGFAPDERVKLLEALGAARELYGDRCAPDGEPWLDRALGTAAIVAGLKLDLDSVRAAIMIGAPHIDGLDILFADERQDFFGCHASLRDNGRDFCPTIPET